MYLGEDPARDPKRISGRSTREAHRRGGGPPGARGPAGRHGLHRPHRARRVGHRRRALQPAGTGSDGRRVRDAPRPVRGADGGLREHGELERRLRRGALGQEPRRHHRHDDRRREEPDAVRRVLRRGVRAPTGADGDKDGRVSVLEAFNWARDPRGRLVQAGRPAAHRARACSTTTATARARTRPGSPAETARWPARCSCRPRRPRRAVPTRPIPNCARWWLGATRSKRASPPLKAAKDKTDPDEVRAGPGAAADRSGAGEPGHPGEAEVMKTMLGRARGRRRVAAAAVARGPVAAGPAGPAAGRAVRAAGGLPPQRPRGANAARTVRAGTRGHALRPARTGPSRRTSSPARCPTTGATCSRGCATRRACRPTTSAAGGSSAARGRGAGSALVARLPARRAQLHEDPRGDHDARSVHGPARRRHRGHRLAGPVQVPGLLHGGGRLLDADRRRGEEPARLPAQGRLHDLRRLPRERLGELRGADEARPARRPHGRDSDSRTRSSTRSSTS